MRWISRVPVRQFFFWQYEQPIAKNANYQDIRRLVRMHERGDRLPNPAEYSERAGKKV
jgi:hypothetical protein